VPLYDYSGFDAQGRKVSGVKEGGGRRSVLAELREQGIYATQLREESTVRRRQWSFSWRRGVSNQDLAIITRQLATLLQAGLALDTALATIAEQLEQPGLARILTRVRDDVVQGESFHASLGRQENLFPALYLSMVQVGESSGTLDQVLERLADFLEDQEQLRGKVRAALAYPVLMGVVGVGVLIFLVTFVLPKVTRMIEDLDQQLPLATRALIGLSDLLQNYGWLILLLAALCAWFGRRWASTEQGKVRLHGWLLKVPMFGRINLMITTARLSRTLATLLQNGVPLLKALEISRSLVQNRVLQDVLETTTNEVREGASLAEPLRRTAVFPSMVPQMVAVGEKSGDLEGMLFRIADAYEHQVELTITGMLSLLEPVMILVMGVLVGGIVMAILLPIFQASQGMG